MCVRVFVSGASRNQKYRLSGGDSDYTPARPDDEPRGAEETAQIVRAKQLLHIII